MILPGLARLGLLQKEVGGQEGVFRVRDCGIKDPIPEADVRKERGLLPAVSVKYLCLQKPSEQHMNGSKNVLWGAFGGRWRALSLQSLIVKFFIISSLRSMSYR